MEKQKNSYLVLLISSIVLFMANIVLLTLKVYKWWLFAIFFIALSLIIVFCAVRLKKVINKIKKLKEEQLKTKTSGNYNVDLYTILGIPVQYNKDGSVKNIYELLGIEPVYDENGNRILTIYELLQIMPTFDSQGKEVPTVTVIKNRVGRIAKVDVSDRVLTRKLTDEEKEAIAIREMLTQKLKEAEKQGDSQKQQAIKRVLNQNKQKEVKKEESVKYKWGKEASALGIMKIDYKERSKDDKGKKAVKQKSNEKNVKDSFDVKKKTDTNSETKKPSQSTVVKRNPEQFTQKTENKDIQQKNQKFILVNIDENERGME